MFILNVSSQILMSEISVDGGYITEFEVEVLDERLPEDFEVAGLPVGSIHDSGIPGGSQAKVGTIRFDLLNVGLVCNNGESILEVCDADSDTWDGVAGSFLTDDSEVPGYYKEIKGLEDCCMGNVLLILDIELEEPYLGRGVEMTLTQRIINTLGYGCDLAVFYYADQYHEVRRYTEMGFKLGPYPGYMYLNLVRKHPVVSETIDGEGRSLCRFIAKSSDTPQEVQVN